MTVVVPQVQITKSDLQTRLTTLDGLRGTAAVSVMVFHFVGLFRTGRSLPSAYLAVDMFFILSGFILSHLYETPLREGRGTVWFMGRRLLRLYPVYFVGSAIAVAGFFLAMAKGSRNIFPDYTALFKSVTLHAFVLPTPGFGNKDPLFPVNSPSWSVFLELIANIIYSNLAGYISTRSLYYFLIFATACLIGSASYYGSLDLGADWLTVAGGVARVLAEFSLGVLIGRLSPKWTRVPTWASWALPVAMLATFLPNWTGSMRVAYDLSTAIFLYPVLVLVGSRVEPAGVQRRCYEWLGSISYPLYLLHMPLTYISAGLWARVFHGAPELYRPYSGLCFSGLAIAGAAAVAVMLDDPVQRFLKRRRTRSHALDYQTALFDPQRIEVQRRRDRST